MKALLMRRETPSLVVLLVGAWIVRLVLSDDYKLYVKDGFGPWLLVAGALLCLAAIAGLWLVVRGRPGAMDHNHDHGSSDDGSSDGGSVDGGAADGGGHRSYVGWVLLAPLIAFTLVVPKPLGSFSAERAAAPPPVSQDFGALPEGDPVDVTLMDYTSRSLWDGGKTLEGRTVRMVGFVTAGADGGMYLTRLVIGCCAADALPVKVLIVGSQQTYPVDTWLEVIGTVAPSVRDETNSFDLAAVAAESVKPTGAPASPYEQ